MLGEASIIHLPFVGSPGGCSAACLSSSSLSLSFFFTLGFPSVTSINRAPGVRELCFRARCPRPRVKPRFWKTKQNEGATRRCLNSPSPERPGTSLSSAPEVILQPRLHLAHLLCYPPLKRAVVKMDNPGHTKSFFSIFFFFLFLSGNVNTCGCELFWKRNSTA